jgi:hypothetical protein
MIYTIYTCTHAVMVIEENDTLAIYSGATILSLSSIIIEVSAAALLESKYFYK